MMKVKVLKQFIDGENKTIHKIGKVIEVTEDRFEQLVSSIGDPLVEIFEGALPPNLNSPIDLDENVETLKNTIKIEFGIDSLKDLLKVEQEGKNRKGVIEHIESLLKEGE
jgi:hypothetical protein